MDESPSALDARIAQQVRSLRAARQLSLDALAAASGVSRSMISLVERGESSPTAVLLERLATALGVPLASLFEPADPPPGPLARAADQPWWRDPHTGYRRRNVSPPGSALHIVEVRFPALARVAYETAEREPALQQQVWVLQGTIEVAWGEALHRLDAGDCLAMTLDRPVAFHNPGPREARYAVVIGAAPALHRPGGRRHAD